MGTCSACEESVPWRRARSVSGQMHGAAVAETENRELPPLANRKWIVRWLGGSRVVSDRAYQHDAVTCGLRDRPKSVMDSDDTS